MKISVLIPCRNEKRHIESFLESILAQELDPDWQLEVLVADGRSDDGTLELLRDYARRHPAIRVIDNPGRIVSTGLNAAILASCGEVIIRMDAHTVYAKNYISECVKVLAETGADNVGGPWVAKGKGLAGKAIAAAFRSPFCTGGGKSHDPDYEGEVDTVYLGCWKRSVFDTVGLFDPMLVRNQDDEFNLRLRLAGGKIWQSPRIQSVYTPRDSFRALYRQYLQYGYWKVAVIRKHKALASWRHAVPVLFIGSLLTLMLLIAASAALHHTAILTAAASLLALEMSVYALACVAASLPFAKSVETPVLMRLPSVMAIYQVSYGLGFLMGILTPAQNSTPKPARSGLFTALTR